MTRNHRTTFLAALLAALAGLVDAMGFVHLHGFFVSFMSGNSTRMSVSLAQGDAASASAAGLLIVFFVFGAMAGAALEQSVNRRRRALVLAAESLVLFTGAILHQQGIDRAAVGAMAFGMGLENAVFVHAGRVSVGLTYVTGALVKAAHGIVAVLYGARPLQWVPDALLWLSLILGAVAGTRLYAAIGLDGLWVAAAVSSACLMWTWVDRDNLDS